MLNGLLCGAMSMASMSTNAVLNLGGPELKMGVGINTQQASLKKARDHASLGRSRRRKMWCQSVRRVRHRTRDEPATTPAGIICHRNEDGKVALGEMLPRFYLLHALCHVALCSRAANTLTRGLSVTRPWLDRISAIHLAPQVSNRGSSQLLRGRPACRRLQATNRLPTIVRMASVSAAERQRRALPTTTQAFNEACVS